MKKLKTAVVTTMFVSSLLLSNNLLANAQENDTTKTESIQNVNNNVESNKDIEKAKIKDFSKKKLNRNSSLYKSFKKTKNYSTKYKYLKTLDKEYNSYLKSSYKEESTIKDYKSKLSYMKKVIKNNYTKLYKANYKTSKTNLKSLKSKSKNLSALYKRIKSEGLLVLGTSKRSIYLNKVRDRYLVMNNYAGKIEARNMAKNFIKKTNYKGYGRYYCPVDKNKNIVKKECTFVNENRDVYYMLSGKKLKD